MRVPSPRPPFKQMSQLGSGKLSNLSKVTQWVVELDLNPVSFNSKVLVHNHYHLLSCWPLCLSNNRFSTPREKNSLISLPLCYFIFTLFCLMIFICIAFSLHKINCHLFICFSMSQRVFAHSRHPINICQKDKYVWLSRILYLVVEVKDHQYGNEIIVTRKVLMRVPPWREN